MGESLAIFLLLSLMGIGILVVLTRTIGELRRDIERLTERHERLYDEEGKNYWRLWHKQEALLSHLGLEVKEQSAKTIVVKR